MFSPADPERFKRLSKLSPIAAVEVWLDGDFGWGDEPALILAIRRDKRVKLPDDEIIDMMADAMIDGEDDFVDPAVILEKLAVGE